ncbi:unnamed protein product, partial [Closterium sp. NIES-54]
MRALAVHWLLPVAHPGCSTVSARCAPLLRVGSCPSHAPGARRFLHAQLIPHPRPPPPPPWGCWGESRVAVGGGCTSSAPLLSFVTKPAVPPRPPPPFFSIPLL